MEKMLSDKNEPNYYIIGLKPGGRAKNPWILVDLGNFSGTEKFGY